MQIRHKYESDGKCFAKTTGGCLIFGGKCKTGCGTYKCDFYKPDGCKDWIRCNSENGLVKLFPPEEVSYGKDK
jgi:hypothetical protein